jgi:hypothetical protein
MLQFFLSLMAVAIDPGPTFGKDYAGKDYNITLLQSPPSASANHYEITAKACEGEAFQLFQSRNTTSDVHSRQVQNVLQRESSRVTGCENITAGLAATPPHAFGQIGCAKKRLS